MSRDELRRSTPLDRTISNKVAKMKRCQFPCENVGLPRVQIGRYKVFPRAVLRHVCDDQMIQIAIRYALFVQQGMLDETPFHFYLLAHKPAEFVKYLSVAPGQCHYSIRLGLARKRTKLIFHPRVEADAST